MAGGSGVASRAGVVRAVGLKVGSAAAGIAGQDSGVRATVGGASKWGRDGERGGLEGRSTLHKGSSDSGSKRRKVAEGGVLDVKGRRAGVVTCW